MGKINNVMNHYFGDSRRFADLFNAAWFGGEAVVRAESLSDASEVYYGPGREDGRKVAAGLRRECRRDVCKQLRDGPVLRLLALESQDFVDFAMPFRGMRYDVLNYERQVEELRQRNRAAGLLKTGAERLCGLRRGDRLAPVYTLCLYHGAEKWNGPRKLSDMMDFGEDGMFREWFKDYPLHLYCVNEAEDLSAFRTEAGKLLRALPYQKDREGLKRLLEESPDYRRVDRDTLEALSAVLKLPKVWTAREKYRREEEEKEKEEYDMCQAVEEWAEIERREGREEGIKEGREEGIKEGGETKLIQQVQGKLRKGKTAEKIAEDLEEPLEKVKQILKAVESCCTEDPAEIYSFLMSRS